MLTKLIIVVIKHLYLILKAEFRQFTHLFKNKLCHCLTIF